MKELTYEGTTYNSKNLFARFAHRERFKISLLAADIQSGEKVLDYGCGDGKFLESIQTKCSKVGFEPYMASIQGSKVIILNSIDVLKAYVNKNGLFDVIVCFEVMEHLNEKNEGNMLAEMSSLLAKNGRIVISVPVEIGLPTILKNVRRRLLYKAPQYSLANIVKSVFAMPLEEYRDREGYLCHMGFNHQKLEKLLRQNFHITEVRNSPFNFLNYNFNSQKFYTIKPL